MDTDNNKLVGILKAHGVTVLKDTPQRIQVEDMYCLDGKAYSEPKWVNASMPAVKEFLGY